MKKIVEFHPQFFFQILVKFRTRKKEFRSLLEFSVKETTKLCQKNITGNATHSFNSKSGQKGPCSRCFG